jgi:hypothetical protein
MRDSEYILNELVKMINANLESVENRLINGSIYHIEDYKYNLGARYTLSSLSDFVKELSRGN